MLDRCRVLCEGDRLNRGTRITRRLPVRDLNPAEAAALIVTAHDASPDRRRAYLFTQAGGDWRFYFKPEEVETIRVWMTEEA